MDGAVVGVLRGDVFDGEDGDCDLPRGVVLLLLAFTVAAILGVSGRLSVTWLDTFGVMNGVNRDKEGKKAKRDGVSVKMLSVLVGRLRTCRSREGG